MRAARPAIAVYDVIVRVKRVVAAADIDAAAAEGARLVRQLASAPIALAGAGS
jgi:hypothetical protein